MSKIVTLRYLLVLPLCLLALGVTPRFAGAVAANSEAAAEAVATPPFPSPAQPLGTPEAGFAPAGVSGEALLPETTPTQPAVVQPAAVIPIVSVEVAGNEHVASEEILKAIGSTMGGFYTEEQLARDREAVLKLGWFQTVAAEREIVEHGVRLIFRVRENPVIRDIQFDGIRILTRDELLSVMRTRPGAIYNIRWLEQDAQAIENLYASRGYILAIVLEMRRITENGVLTLNIAEGVIESVKITGNSYTKTYVIQRYLRAKPGDVYNARKVSQDVTRLSNTGYFESVRTDAEVGEEPGKIILIFIIVEKQRTGEATVGFGYASVQGAIGYLDVHKDNLRGTGQAVSVRGEFGGRKSYELGYRNPWVMTPETRLNIGIYDRFILREAFITSADTRRNVFYRERRTGGNFTLGRPLSEHTTAYVGLRRDDVSLSDVKEEDEPFLSGPAFTPRKVRSLTLAAVTDTRENPVNPRAGAFQQISAELAGLLGGSRFSKYAVDNRRYFQMGKKNVLALRLLLGTVTGDAPYLEQFLIGGLDSLRGFRVDRFAGSRMAILNTEYRFPLSSNLTGVGFVDVGDAWGGPISADPFLRGDKTFKAHFGYGVGVRVQTPVGPIRLDLGFSEEGTETHFGISNMF